MVPSKIFFVKGVGVHKDQLASFEAALRSAGIEKYNLVYVSSIFPPNCKQISRVKGLALLSPGEIVHCVMARIDTNEPGRQVFSAIGVAHPADRDRYGYLSEHHGYGQNAKTAADYSEDLAATMLATTLGLPFDPDQNWNERKQVYMASGRIFKTRSICQTSKGDPKGRWTTALTAAVLLG
jgi:arginine decarboxylase